MLYTTKLILAIGVCLALAGCEPILAENSASGVGFGTEPLIK